MESIEITEITAAGDEHKAVIDDTRLDAISV
jgi:hypothetical protein